MGAAIEQPVYTLAEKGINNISQTYNYAQSKQLPKQQPSVSSSNNSLFAPVPSISSPHLDISADGIARAKSGMPLNTTRSNPKDSQSKIFGKLNENSFELNDTKSLRTILSNKKLSNTELGILGFGAGIRDGLLFPMLHPIQTGIGIYKITSPNYIGMELCYFANHSSELKNILSSSPHYFSDFVTNSYTQAVTTWNGNDSWATGHMLGSGAALITPLPVSALGKIGIFGTVGKVGNRVESVVNLTAKNHLDGLRLQKQLQIEHASSIFNENGYLTHEVISESDLLLRGNQLRNPELIEALSGRGNLADWGKYSTKSFASPSGEFQMHFYYNSVTKDVYYGKDYKAVFNHQGKWNLELKPNFDFEPPRFNK